MRFQVEEISPVEKKVAVEIEWPFVAAKLDEAYRKLGRGVALKGFRKGKVPRDMLERMYSHQVERDVTQELVQDSFMRAAEKHELSPVAEPIVEEIHLHKGAPFRYSARVEVRATFDPKEYTGIELERPAAVVSDADVQRALDAKRDELTEYKKIEGRDVITESDVLFLDIDGTVGEHKVKREGVMVDIGGAGEGREPLPGLGQQLLGASLTAAGLEVVYVVPEPPPAPEGVQIPAEIRAVVGQEARVKITIKDSREKIVPTVDDDFAKDTGDADSLDELREKLREKLKLEKEEAISQQLRSDLVKEIVRKNPFEVAPALVERQIQALVHRTKMQMAMRGMDPRVVPIDEPKLRESLREAATGDVRAAFLVDAIGTIEKVDCTDADLEKKLAELARTQNKSVQRLKAELQKENRLESLRYQLREEKTLDLLMSRANITSSR